ncbi:MAG: diaminopimelate decarboxylase [Chloroflexota bacterium]|nr:diaminopimelate decarboxylase [Chloroflexota bacterium]
MSRSYSEFVRVDDHGQLRVDGVAAADLADAFGTPLYVITEQQIHANMRAITSAFRRHYPRTEILFANKANNNPSVRTVFSQAGAGGDCFGYNELYLSILGGANPDLLVLNGSNKQEPELALAIEVGATVSLDNLEELESVETTARRMATQARVQPRTRLELQSLDGVVSDWPKGIPIGPGARGHKFGMHYEDVLESCRRARASEWLDLVGLHHHVGRWTNDPLLLETVVREQVEWVARLRDALNWSPRQLDMGGGLAWGRPEGHGPDASDRTAPDYGAYAEAMVGALKAALARFDLEEPLLLLEPGRALASNIGILLSRVGVVKKWPGHKTWVNVDASQNHLPNILSANWYYHAVAVADADPDPAKLEEVDLVGPLCTFDVMGAGRAMPRLKRGDLVAFLDTGAYGETKAALFNAQPRPATVLVNGEQADVITERETLQDILGRFRIPPRLLTGRRALLTEEAGAELAGAAAGR